MRHEPNRSHICRAARQMRDLWPGYHLSVSAAPIPLKVEPTSVHGSPALRAARDGERTPRATPAAAFRAARRMFLQGRRLDMQAVGAERGVSRATLYHWTGHRVQLRSAI